MSHDKKGSPGSEHTQVMLVGALLGFAVVAKVWPIVHTFYIEHRITIILALWLIAISAITILCVRLWNSYVKRCAVESIN